MNRKSTETRELVLIGMMVALVTVGTFINIQTPWNIGGLIHLGTLVTFVIALKYGPKYGALAGGIGAAIFDLYYIYLLWVPATLLIRLFMGYVVGMIATSKEGFGTSNFKNFIAITVGGVMIVVGYFIFQAFLLAPMGETNPEYYGVSAALYSIPGNVVQYLLGLFSLIVIKYLPNIELQGSD